MDPLKIAVVGSGISGLSAAWLLSQRHTVTLIESDDRLGGHSHTVDCLMDGVPVAIDTGFIVYNQGTYPNLTALFEHLKLPTTGTSMGFGVSLDGGRYEYSGNGALQMLGHLSNLSDPGHWRMLRDVARFFRTARIQALGVGGDVSLGQFMAEQGYSSDFVRRHLLPMAGAIWSCEPQRMLAYPARSFLKFFDNHGLLKFVNRPQWRTVTGGSREYVHRLMAGKRIRTLTGCQVTSIKRRNAQIHLHAKNDFHETFDHVVLGAHADQALAMLGDPTPEEQRCLSAFPYARNRVVLHRDASFMPRRRRLWSSWNYQSSGEESTGAVTYWMNALQPLPASTNFFVTVNPPREPLAGTVEREFVYEHPVFTVETAQEQQRLWALQGKRSTWFCGAYFGAGFHEDGLQAGLAVAEQLGDLKRPWSVSNPSGRIHVHQRTLASPPLQFEAAE